MNAHSPMRRFRMIGPAYPAFNIYSRIARKTTALGPLHVATMVSRLPNWDVEVTDENNYRQPGPRDVEGHPDHSTLQQIRHADVIGLYGGLSSTIPRLYQLADFYRRQGAITIAGGQHFVGDNIREALTHGVDYVVIGEGELTIQALLEVIETGKDPASVAGIAYLKDGVPCLTPPRPPITDFDALPLPDFHLLRYAKLTLYPINWIRGCGMNCEFCTVKGRPRAASPERIIRQIANLLESHNARHFFIVDDLFGHNRDDTLTLCRLMADYQRATGVRLDFTVQIRLDRGRDREMLSAMRNAGVNTVCIGYESPLPEELAAMDKRIKPGEMLELTRLYRKAGFLVHGMFIFGYPLPRGAVAAVSAGERIRQFRRFICRSRLDSIQVLLPVPLPGTELTARLEADHRVFPRTHIGWEYYDGNFPLFLPDPPMTPETMHMAIRKIMGRFYRFRNMFAIGRNVLIFPALVFSLWNIRFGWRTWYRSWRNDLIKFGGWIMLRRWTSGFNRSPFTQKLNQAKNSLAQTPSPPPP